MTMDYKTMTNAEHAALAELADELFEEKVGPLPECPWCGTTMEFRHGNIHRAPCAWGQNRKCPNCYALHAWGLPMTEPEYEEILELQHGRQQYRGTPAEDIEEGEIGEQLAALGYLEM